MTVGASHITGTHRPVRVDGPVAPEARTATTCDLDAIHSVLAGWSEVGLTLPRSRDDLERHIGTFSVTVTGEIVSACASLHLYDTPPGLTVAELRSVASTPASRGSGSASLVVDHCLERAAAMGIERVHLLCRAPGFFARRGFGVVRFREVPPEFLEHAVRRQGRTTAGRTCMVRETSPG